MSEKQKVLLVDDRVADIGWLVRNLDALGYDVDQVTNEAAARSRFQEARDSLAKGGKPYALAIVDIMLPIMDIEELVDLDEEFFADSSQTGIRLCRFARRELGIKEEQLPIVSLTAGSDDENVKKALAELDVRVFSRVPQSKDEDEDIREYLKKRLPKLGKPEEANLPT